MKNKYKKEHVIRYIYIIIIVLTTIQACHVLPEQKVPIIHFCAHEDLVFEVPNNDGIQIQKVLEIDSLGNFICTMINATESKYYKINYTNGIILDTFDLNVHKRQFINNYIQIHPDTFLVAFNSGDFGGYHDWLISKVARTGTKATRVSLEGAPVEFYNDTIQLADSLQCYVNYMEFPLIYYRGSLVVPLSRWDSEYYCHLNDSMVRILSMGKSGGFQRLPIGDDAPPNGYCWGTDYHKPRGSWDGQSIFYAFFGHSNKIYRYYVPNITITYIAWSCLIPY